MVAHVDIETFDELKLKNPKGVGLHRYAEHESCEILVLCYAIDDGPVATWIPAADCTSSHWIEIFENVPGVIHWGVGCPEDLRLQNEFRAHNAEFERTILNGHAGAAIGFPFTKIEQWTCTAAKTAAMGLPRKLGDAAYHLALPHQKDEEGKRIMQQLTQPKKPSKKDPNFRHTPELYPEKFAALYRYCIDDVLTERSLDHALPDLPPLERRVHDLDQRMNDRGIRADVKTATIIQDMIDEWKGRLEVECQDLTFGLNPTQTGKLKEFCHDNSVYIPDLQAPTIDEYLEFLENKTEPGQQLVRRILEIRRSHAGKAVSKFEAILRSVMIDGRLRGMFLYYGAGTGRWSSLIVQLQNLYRGHPDIDPEIAIQAILSGNLDWVMALWDHDPNLVFACCIRAMLIASEGHDLLCCDYSSIEARITAWFAGQKDILEVFRTHGMVYEHTAAKMMGWDFKNVEGVLLPMKKEHPLVRFSGKTCTLACGFQGGPHAYIRGAKQAGVVVEEEEALAKVRSWRASNKKIVSMWYELQDAFKAAVDYPGQVYSVGRLAFKKQGDFLFMRLPSGRRLSYFKPFVNSDGDITYMGIDTETRQFRSTHTYGGRITENAVQGTAADIQRRGGLALDEAGYPLVLTVHDELGAEVEEDWGSVKEMSEIMCRPIKWADGLPLSADGFRVKRYRKD